MVSVTLKIPDEKFSKISDQAEKKGVSAEALLFAGIDSVFFKEEESFDAHLEYVLKKNQELYERLA